MAPTRKKGAIKTKLNQFCIGDLVLARILGFPPWPAKVSRPKDWNRKPNPKKYFVQFFGTQEIAFVAPSDVQPFTSESKSKLVAKCKGRTVKYFAQAVKEICEASEELEKSDRTYPDDDTTTHGHDASNVEERNADGSSNELIRKPKSETLSGSESALDCVSGLVCRSSMEGLLKKDEYEKSSGCDDVLEEVQEMDTCKNFSNEASLCSSLENKADTVPHRERIESSRAPSSRSNAKLNTSYHGDGKKDSPSLLGASLNLKSSSVGDKKSANGHRSQESIVRSKRKNEGLFHHTDDVKSGVSIKDKTPQKLLSGEKVKQVPPGVNRSEHGSRGKTLHKNPKHSDVGKSTPQNECGEGEYSRRKECQPRLEQLQSVKKAKLVQPISDSGKGSTTKTEKRNVDPKIHDEEAVFSVGKRNRQAVEAPSDVNISAEDRRSFGLGSLKSNILKKRRAVCLYNDDDDDEEPKTPVHGGSLSTIKVGSSAIIQDSLKSNENHDTSSHGEASPKVSIREATGSQSLSQLKVDDSTTVQECHSPRKEESNKRTVKEAEMDLLSPAKSLLVAAAKRSVEQQKPNRLPAKTAILQSHSKGQSVPGNGLKSVSGGSNSAQKSRLPLSGERVKGISKISAKFYGPASLDDQMDHDSALHDGRLGDAKDRSSSLVDPKALNSSVSMKHLIAAAQAKRRHSLTQIAPQATVNSVSAPTANVPRKSTSPVSMTHGSSSGMGNVTEHDAQGVHLSESPHFHIRQLDSEEPEDKGPGSGHQGSGSTLSGGTEAAVARDAFEGMIETLSRTKESIGRATRLAIDCAKYGIVNEVVELLIHKLENETIIHRRVDLFFLVDSITQCSHSQKGIAGASYIPIVQAALPRLLGAAAPSGSNAKENRRQCLKVLRLWLERKIFPESVLRRFMDDIGGTNDDIISGFTFRRPSKSERSVDDPIRSMEGMLVDEYGSNATFNLPGFLSAHGFVDDDDEDEDDVPRTSLKEIDASLLQPLNNSGERELGIGTPNDRIHHILEEVNGELEMEDVSGHLNDGTLSPNYLLAKEKPEMLLDARLEISINDVVESPVMEGSPPLPSESPPPLPPLPTSPPPPLPPSSPSPPPPPPPPPMLHLQPLPPLVSSGPPQVGNLQPPLAPQPSVAPQLFLHPPSLAPPSDYSVSAGTHLVPIDCNTSQQVPSFPTAPSGSLNTPGYSSVYGVPQAGQSNQQFQQNQQFLPSQTTFTPRAFRPVTVPQPPSGHFSYNPTNQVQMPHPPLPVASSHPYSASYSEGPRRMGDEQWRAASVGFKSDSQYNSWANGGCIPSCPPTKFIGEAYFRPSEMALTDSMGYQISAPNPSMAGPVSSGHGINQMLPPMPDMTSLNYWRPV